MCVPVNQIFIFEFWGVAPFSGASSSTTPLCTVSFISFPGFSLKALITRSQLVVFASRQTHGATEIAKVSERNFLHVENQFKQKKNKLRLAIYDIGRGDTSAPKKRAGENIARTHSLDHHSRLMLYRDSKIYKL